MEIFLVRHAQPEWVKDGLNIDDPPLTDLGRRQAELLGDWLRGEHFDEVLVSPLLRTRQTAQPILEAVGKSLVLEPWLEEIRSPLWHGTPEQRAVEAYRAEREKFSHERWTGLEGGEAVSDFVDRINVGASLFLEERGIRRLDTSLPVWTTTDSFVEESRIALVAHAGTNSVVICHLLGLQPTPWEWERFVIGHATISRIRTLPLGDGITFGLSRLSGDEHLPLDARTG